jgi:AbrB family looped-hinge helix DNA binding protein
MKTTIDAAGRIVVPKALREELGVKAGQLLELEVRDGRLEVEVAPVEMAVERRARGPVAVPKGKMPPLTSALVRETLERTRR